jgi:CubicO group peptidase (beta-lactamase class C family)
MYLSSKTRPYPLILAMSIVFSVATASAQPGGEASSFPTFFFTPIERDMKAGETHHYGVNLKAKRHLLLLADQQGIDVAIRFFAPDGELLEEVDRLGTTGVEALSIFISSTGFHGIEIRSSGQNGPDRGTYSLKIESLERAARKPARRVDQLLAHWNRPGSPGAAIAVVRNGKVVLERGYGLANLEHQIPITPSTVFDVASISKQFTGLAVAILVKQGKLALDDDYRKHLPEMSDYGPTVTIDHLVHHTSGIRDWPGALALAGRNMSDVISFEQILTLARNLRELNFVPGDEYSYSNTNYNLLAETAARVTGQTFQSWTREKILLPLGMTNTHFQHDETTVIKNRASGYRFDHGEFRLASSNLAAMGSSSLYATVEDLARWAINFETAEIGGAKAVELMHTPGMLNNGEPNKYAFGVMLGEHRGLPTVRHSGGWAGFRSTLWRFPKQRFAVIVLANSFGFDPEGTARKIAEIYLRREIAAAEKAQAAEREGEEEPSNTPLPNEARDFDAETFDDYVGHWQFSGGLLVVIKRDGGRLMAQPQGESAVELLPDSRDEFRVNGGDARVVFHRDEQGGVNGATLVERGKIDGKRVEMAEPTGEELTQYTGRYFSAELEAIYTVAVKHGRLVARHRRYGEIKLRPTTRDGFQGDRWPFGTIEFTRNEAGTVDTMLVTAGERVRNMRFSRWVSEEDS